MAEYTLHEGFPDLLLQPGMILRLNAIDPTTGAEVAGVTSSKWSIYGTDLSDLADDLLDKVPGWTPEVSGGGFT